MGRKVHPIGFRLGIIQDWRSRWYADKRQYAQLLHEDLAIRKLIREQVGHAGISEIEIERFPNQVVITMHTAKPGVVIGRRGAAVKELREALEKLAGGKRIKLEVKEIEKPDLCARLVAESIVDQIERRVSHARAMRRAAQQVMRAGAQGVMITCAGRLAGAEMARKETVREGRVPRHTLRADIDYAQVEALTTYGRIGVKVWIYRGEVLPEQEEAAS